MTDLIDTVQLQQVGDALIELFDIELPNGTMVYAVNGLDDGSTNIYFPQKAISGSTYPLKEYVALPINIDGMEATGAGAAPRPTLTTANIPTLTRSVTNDDDGTDDEETLYNILSDNNFEENEDLLGTRITYRRTLFANTYDKDDSNPSTPPKEFPSQVYVIDRVHSENPLFVSFELASPIDVEGLALPNRQIIGRYCSWRYQGGSLDDDGGCSWPLDGNGRFFDEEDGLITRDISTITAWDSTSTFSKDDKVKTTSDSHTQIWLALTDVPANKNPTSAYKYWKRLDVCSKTLTGCKKRFQGNNTNATLDTAIALPFGGFPGSKKFK